MIRILLLPLLACTIWLGVVCSVFKYLLPKMLPVVMVETWNIFFPGHPDVLIAMIGIGMGTAVVWIVFTFLKQIGVDAS